MRIESLWRHDSSPLPRSDWDIDTGLNSLYPVGLGHRLESLHTLSGRIGSSTRAIPMQTMILFIGEKEEKRYHTLLMAIAAIRISLASPPRRSHRRKCCRPQPKMGWVFTRNIWHGETERCKLTPPGREQRRQTSSSKLSLAP